MKWLALLHPDPLVRRQLENTMLQRLMHVSHMRGMLLDKHVKYMYGQIFHMLCDKMTYLGVVNSLL